MNWITPARWLAVLCLSALAGCAADGMSGGSGGGGVPAAGTAGAGSSGMDSTAQASYGVVLAIEPMRRSDMRTGAMGSTDAAESRSTSATSATSSDSANSATATDPAYRITVRMDNGTDQMLVVDTMPPYRVGDRVRYSNGALNAY